MTRSREIGAVVRLARDELVALCRALVAAPSVNPPGDTSAAAAIVLEYLARHGVEARLEHVALSMPNVVATVHGSGPGPHLVLNVHLDTMPAGDESRWSVPRFELTERDGRLYGLGMGNMKGAVAAMCLATVLLERSRDDWPGRVTFTAVADECVFGDNGAAFLLAGYPELAGDALLCGEGPGWMRLGVAEKGVAWFELTAAGSGGHASNAAAGTSAISRLARIVLELEELNSLTASPPTGLEPLASVGGQDPFRLSVNVGTIRGGSFVSQIPTSASAEVDLRIPPGMTVSRVDELLASRVAATEGVSLRRIRAWEPNWTVPDSPIVQAVAAAATAVRGRASRSAIRLPASDASRWRARDVPAVCFGPQPTLSAGVDDYALERDVLHCAEIYVRAAISYLRSARR
jgi:succinyl-diaminopimelate desuccinylase